MSSIAAGVAIGAATSGGAHAAAQQARVTWCRTFVQDYQHSSASAAERREYASCVQVLDPQPPSKPLVGGLLVLVAAGIIGGALWGGGGRPDTEDRVIFAALGGVLVPIVGLAALGIFSALAYVVGG